MKVRYRLLLRLLPCMRPHWPTIAAGAVLALVDAGVGGLLAWLVKPVMDDIFLRRDLVMLKLVPLAVLGAYLLR